MTISKTPPPAPEVSASSTTAASADVALVHHVTPDGVVHVIRRRGDQIEAGALQPLREGAPIHGEVVSLRPRPHVPQLCDVEVLYVPPASPAVGEQPAQRARPTRRKGPAQVATDTYRDNWDSIWSGKKNDALN